MIRALTQHDGALRLDVVLPGERRRGADYCQQRYDDARGRHRGWPWVSRAGKQEREEQRRNHSGIAERQEIDNDLVRRAERERQKNAAINKQPGPGEHGLFAEESGRESVSKRSR